MTNRLIDGSVKVSKLKSASAPTAGQLLVVNADGSRIDGVSPGTITGALVTSGEITDTISSTQNNYAPTGLATAAVLTVTPSSASRTITGLAAPSGSVQQRLVIRNGAAVVTGYTLTLSHQSASSTSANRWFMQGGVDLVLQPGETAEFEYLGSFWRLLGKNASASGPATSIVESGGPTNLAVASIADAELLIRASATVDGVALGDLAQSGGSLQVTQSRGLRETGGPTTLAMGSVADAYLLGRSGSSIIGVPTGTSSGVALYADERFDDLTDTINFVTANSGATDLTGNGIFQGITGSGGGSNGTSRYGRYRRNTTGTVSGNTQYQSNTVTDAYLAMGPRLIFKQAISRTTSIRAFIGYSTTSAPQGMSADDTAGATIGFQYSTPRGDASIKFIWDDGATQGTDSTGVSFTADVPLVFVIDWDRVNAKVTGRIYSTSGSAWSQVYSRTQTTGLPADSTSLYIGAGVQTQAASAVYIDTYYWRAKIRGL